MYIFKRQETLDCPLNIAGSSISSHKGPMYNCVAYYFSRSDDHVTINPQGPYGWNGHCLLNSFVSRSSFLKYCVVNNSENSVLSVIRYNSEQFYSVINFTNRHVRLKTDAQVALLRSCFGHFIEASVSWITFRSDMDRAYIDGLVRDCSNSVANTSELLQSCAKPSICNN